MSARDRRPESDPNDALVSAGATSETVDGRDDARKDERGAPVRRTDSEPDVLLDVPALEVKEIELEVGELRARVSLHASVGSLVSLDAGADVRADHVKLDLEGVDAQARLKVHLARVYGIITRALDSIDQNPEVLERSQQPAGDDGHERPRELQGAPKTAAEPKGGAVVRTVEEPGRVEKTFVEPQPAFRRLAARTRKRVGDRIAEAAHGTWDVRGSAVQAREAIASAARKMAGVVKKRAPQEPAGEMPSVDQAPKEGDAASVPEDAVRIEASAHADELRVDEASGETLQGRAQTHRSGLPPEGAERGVPYRDVDVGIDVQGAPPDREAHES